MKSLRQKATTLAATAALILTLFHGGAIAEENWRQSFDDICAKTEQAMTLSVSELDTLLQRCAALKKVIEAQEESVRKVYLKRLQLCSNLYSYVLDYKKNGQTSSN